MFSERSLFVFGKEKKVMFLRLAWHVNTHRLNSMLYGYKTLHDYWVWWCMSLKFMIAIYSFLLEMWCKDQLIIYFLKPQLKNIIFTSKTQHKHISGREIQLYVSLGKAWLCRGENGWCWRSWVEFLYCMSGSFSPQLSYSKNNTPPTLPWINNSTLYTHTQSTRDIGSKYSP